VASSSDDDEEEGGVNDFLGIDDVLPTNRGVYVVEGSRDETAQDDSLWDGWETVRCVANIFLAHHAKAVSTLTKKAVSTLTALNLIGAQLPLSKTALVYLIWNC
jgi:hypothetical protein